MHLFTHASTVEPRIRNALSKMLLKAIDKRWMTVVKERQRNDAVIVIRVIQPRNHLEKSDRSRSELETL